MASLFSDDEGPSVEAPVEPAQSTTKIPPIAKIHQVCLKETLETGQTQDFANWYLQNEMPFLFDESKQWRLNKVLHPEHSMYSEFNQVILQWGNWNYIVEQLIQALTDKSLNVFGGKGLDDSMLLKTLKDAGSVQNTEEAAELAKNIYGHSRGKYFFVYLSRLLNKCTPFSFDENMLQRFQEFKGILCGNDKYYSFKSILDFLAKQDALPEKIAITLMMIWQFLMLFFSNDSLMGVFATGCAALGPLIALASNLWDCFGKRKGPGRLPSAPTTFTPLITAAVVTLGFIAYAASQTTAVTQLALPGNPTFDPRGHEALEELNTLNKTKPVNLKKGYKHDVFGLYADKLTQKAYPCHKKVGGGFTCNAVPLTPKQLKLPEYQTIDPKQMSADHPLSILRDAAQEKVNKAKGANVWLNVADTVVTIFGVAGAGASVASLFTEKHLSSQGYGKYAGILGGAVGAAGFAFKYMSLEQIKMATVAALVSTSTDTAKFDLNSHRTAAFLVFLLTGAALPQGYIATTQTGAALWSIASMACAQDLAKQEKVAGAKQWLKVSAPALSAIVANKYLQTQDPKAVFLAILEGIFAWGT